MQQTNRYFLRAILGAAACALAMQASAAQDLALEGDTQARDPARWYQQDMTPHARFQTLKKEAGAAYQEALAECRNDENATRAACRQEARAMFEQDLADARQQVQVRRR